MGTVNPTRTKTYDLTTANNPITFGAKTSINVEVGYAVFGDYSPNWNITNRGDLGGGAAGVKLVSISTLTNEGSISGGIGTNSVGVYLAAGGAVTNDKSGQIGGYQDGILVGTVAGEVTNAGSIGGDGNLSTGVVLSAGGKVTNKTGGKISGYSKAVYVAGSVGRVTNAGSIDSNVYAGSHAISLSAGGTVINQAGGAISASAVGVTIAGGAGAVINAGAISGATASIEFAGGGVNELKLETGSSLTGAAVGSTASGATNALILKGRGKAANKFVNFNTLTVSGTWTLGGISAIGATTLSKGKLEITGALTTSVNERASFDLTFLHGLLSVKQKSIFSGSVGGTGTMKMTAGSTLTDSGSVGAGDTFTYTGSTGDLVLDDLAGHRKPLFHGKIAGFAKGDKLDVGAPFGAGTKFVFTENAAHTAGALKLTDGTMHATLTLLGNHRGADFHMTSDGHGGKLFTYG